MCTGAETEVFGMHLRETLIRDKAENSVAEILYSAVNAPKKTMMSSQRIFGEAKDNIFRVEYNYMTNTNTLVLTYM